MTPSQHTGITIGMDETFIQVSEDIGVRQVCASITEGETEREIIVTLFSEDQTATGMCIILC